MTHVLPHEFAHATLATVYERSESALDARWSNEALTEVIAQMVRRYNRPLVEESVIYQEERDLLDAVLRTGTDTAVDLQLATRAYSGTQEECEQFAAAIDAAWGRADVLLLINDVVAALEAVVQDDDERIRQQQALIFVRQQLCTYPEMVWVSAYMARTTH